MKRSEMVKLMWEFIQSVESEYDHYMTEDDTEKLLSKMEAAGVSPPGGEARDWDPEIDPNMLRRFWGWTHD